MNIGVWVFVYYTILPPSEHSVIPELPQLSWFDYHINEKMMGIIMITIGVNIAVRQYIKYKKDQ